MEKQLETVNNGSNYQFGDKMTIANNERSKFDLSHLNTLTIKGAGEVIPIDIIETLPNDDIDITVNGLIRVMPQVVPLYSNQRLYIYAFYSRGGDLWSEFNTFMTKGYTGNEVLEIPTQKEKNFFSNTQTVKPDSLLDYMGIPIGTKATTIMDKKNLLPEMMYLRIWRDYFVNKNYFINNRAILPNNDADFRLNKNGDIQSLVDNNYKLKLDSEFNSTDGNLKISNPYLILGKFYHEYPKDYFTSALPWTQRGTEPEIALNINNGEMNITFDNFKGEFGDNIKINITDTVADNYEHNAVIQKYLNEENQTRLTIKNEGGGTNQVSFYYQSTDPISNKKEIYPQLNGTAPAELTGVVGNITLNQIRELAIAQTELEKLARTDGSYGEFGLTFFGEKSKRADDYKPVYIGGTVTTLQFTEVVQQSESGTTPLGTYAGHGIATQTDGYIGHVHCDDYGYIMILASIMPDVYYSQGLEKKWSRLYQSQYYLPERARLGLQPILNQEIYLDNETDNKNQELWAYQNPFDEYRYKNNEIHGKIADSTNQSFYPYTQSRQFNKLPNWSKEFATATPDQVRTDYLSAPSEDAYSAQFSIKIEALRPLPYKPIPAPILN